MRYEKEKVIERHIFRWKNGRTDLMITQTGRGYHAFDRCFELISDNGTMFDMRSKFLNKLRTTGLLCMEIGTHTKEVLA